MIFSLVYRRYIIYTYHYILCTYNSLQVNIKLNHFFFIHLVFEENGVCVCSPLNVFILFAWSTRHHQHIHKLYLKIYHHAAVCRRATHTIPHIQIVDTFIFDIHTNIGKVVASLRFMFEHRFKMVFCMRIAPQTRPNCVYRYVCIHFHIKLNIF